MQLTLLIVKYKLDQPDGDDVFLAALADDTPVVMIL